MDLVLNTRYARIGSCYPRPGVSAVVPRYSVVVMVACGTPGTTKMAKPFQKITGAVNEPTKENTALLCSVIADKSVYSEFLVLQYSGCTMHLTRASDPGAGATVGVASSRTQGQEVKNIGGDDCHVRLYPPLDL
eukprot:1921887-Rhodomonas_salina.1